ncbi:MAG: glycosyltransferase family 9 protein, partial [Acidobacteriota bacterium]|nr:glycosyltransferase family 9 protein [Acidobacteriota bacterium]
SVDFQGSFKSGVVARLSGAARRVGFDRPHCREWSHVFANVRICLKEDRIHRVERAARLACAAGAADGPLEASLALSAAERSAGRGLVERLVARRPSVSLAPFSSPRQSWKRYPLECWAEVARGLAEGGAGVVVLGGPGEEEASREVCQRAGAGAAPSGPIGLRELASLIAATDLFVGGDTGPMHIAWSCGVPVIAVYGPTDPVINAPFGPGHVILAPEAPTGRHDADPFPGISPDSILSTARRRLGELRTGFAEIPK